MPEKLKQSWQRFKTGSPGQRFQQQFSRPHQARTPIQKALFVGGGILLIIAGIFFLFVPGPGLLIVFLGAVLIARQSSFAARALDWTEVRARRLLTWSVRAWRRSSPALKILLVILALVVVGAVGFGAVRFLISNQRLVMAA